MVLFLYAKIINFFLERMFYKGGEGVLFRNNDSVDKLFTVLLSIFINELKL